jgi:hypothetical protein
MFLISLVNFNFTKWNFQQEIGEEQVDLRSKGLCLVPVSFTRKVKIESPADHHALWCPS